MATTISWINSEASGPTTEPPRISTSGPVGQQFHKTLGFIHDKRFSVVAKRIGGGEVVDGSGSRLVFRKANGGDLGLGENDVEL